MAQVDCQHRLGNLCDLSIPLPFMCFIGLSEREEMEVFSVINSKAKGLSTSLLDYHEAQLAESLAQERPELFIALQLNSIEGVSLVSSFEPRRQDHIRPETDRVASYDAEGG